MADRDFDHIQDLRNQLEIAENSLLAARGWRHTSSTPDSTWLWRKEWQGSVLLVPRGRALAMEEGGHWLDSSGRDTR